MQTEGVMEGGEVYAVDQRIPLKQTAVDGVAVGPVPLGVVDQSAETKSGTANHPRIIKETHICLIVQFLSVLSHSSAQEQGRRRRRSTRGNEPVPSSGRLG
jgi:hypothetical protein